MRLCEQNPLRPPDWRWLRALRIRDDLEPPASRSRDGAAGYGWIRRAVSLLRAADAVRGDADEDRLVRDHGAAYWAWQAFDTNSPMRWALEARLLSRLPLETVAWQVGMSVEVVRAYEALFFNVLSRLDHPAYILHCVIRSADPRQLAGIDATATLWKLYAYHLGPHVLSHIESMFSDAYAVDPTNVAGAIDDDAVKTLKLKSALAAKAIAVNPGTHATLLGLFTEFSGIERSTQSAGQASSVLGDIATALATIPTKMGMESTYDLPDNFDPRYEELCGVSGGYLEAPAFPQRIHTEDPE